MELIIAEAFPKLIPFKSRLIVPFCNVYVPLVTWSKTIPRILTVPLIVTYPATLVFSPEAGEPNIAVSVAVSKTSLL